MDYYLFYQLNQLAGKSVCLDSIFIFFAGYFEYFLIFLLFLFLLKNFKKYWLMVVGSLAAAGFSRFVIIEVIRWLVPRSRPFVENQVDLLLQVAVSPSFPSGHAAFYFALSTVVYSYNKKAGWCFFAGSVLIAFSRVICGIHWPSDIVAGAIIGIFFGWLTGRILKKF